MAKSVNIKNIPIKDLHTNFDDIAGDPIRNPADGEEKSGHFFSMLADHGRCAENKSIESLSGLGPILNLQGVVSILDW